MLLLLTAPPSASCCHQVSPGARRRPSLRVEGLPKDSPRSVKPAVPVHEEEEEPTRPCQLSQLGSSMQFSEDGGVRVGGFEIGVGGLTNAPEPPPRVDSPLHRNASLSSPSNACGSPAMAGRRRTSVNADDGSNLVIIGKLGKGNGGAVMKALYLPTMKLVALKTVTLYNSERRQQMVQELNMLYSNLADIDFDPFAAPDDDEDEDEEGGGEAADGRQGGGEGPISGGEGGHGEEDEDDASHASGELPFHEGVGSDGAALAMAMAPLPSPRKGRWEEEEEDDDDKSEASWDSQASGEVPFVEGVVVPPITPLAQGGPLAFEGSGVAGSTTPDDDEEEEQKEEAAAVTPPSTPPLAPPSSSPALPPLAPPPPATPLPASPSSLSSRLPRPSPLTLPPPITTTTHDHAAPPPPPALAEDDGRRSSSSSSSSGAGPMAMVGGGRSISFAPEAVQQQQILLQPPPQDHPPQPPSSSSAEGPTTAPPPPSSPDKAAQRRGPADASPWAAGGSSGAASPSTSSSSALANGRMGPGAAMVGPINNSRRRGSQHRGGTSSSSLDPFEEFELRQGMAGTRERPDQGGAGGGGASS